MTWNQLCYGNKNECKKINFSLENLSMIYSKRSKGNFLLTRKLPNLQTAGRKKEKQYISPDGYTDDQTMGN